MTPTAKRIQEIAEANGISIDRESYAAFLANEVCRLEDVDVNETIDMIAELMKEGIISHEDGYRFVVEHHQETADSEQSVVRPV